MAVPQPSHRCRCRTRSQTQTVSSTSSCGKNGLWRDAGSAVTVGAAAGRAVGGQITKDLGGHAKDLEFHSATQQLCFCETRPRACFRQNHLRCFLGMLVPRSLHGCESRCPCREVAEGLHPGVSEGPGVSRPIVPTRRCCCH